MSSTAQLLLALAGLTPIFAAGMANAATTEVTLTVTHTQSSGRVLGRVFADAASFKARAPAVTQFAIDPAGASARTTLALPPGRYAIALFQDVKGTGKLETNLFGVPKVPYGFSNNAKGTLGPPGFDAAAFAVGSAPTAIAIELH